MKFKKLIIILLFITSVAFWGVIPAAGQNYTKQPRPLESYNDILRKMHAEVEQLDKPNMLKSDLEAIVNQFSNHLRNHPEDKAHCYYYMAHYLRHPANLDLSRPMEAFSYYQDALHNIRPGDSTTRSEILFRMGLCFAYQGADMETAIRYFLSSVTLNPKNSAALGDMYFLGWGVNQDLYLATSYYDICQRFQQASGFNNAYCIYYILQRSKQEANDSLALALMERYIYSIQINSNSSAAHSALMASAQMGYAPAQFELGMKIRLGEIDFKGLNDLEWFKLAADQGYGPAYAALARVYAKDADKDANSAKLRYEALIAGEKLGNTNTKVMMGDLYAKGNKFGYPEKDYKKAYCYYLAADRINCNSESQKIIQKLRTQYTPSAQEMKEIEQWADSAYRYYNYMSDQLYEMIEQDKTYNTPRMNFYSTYFQESPDRIDQIDLEGITENHARQYLMVYNIYADLLKGMSLENDSHAAYVNNNGTYIQHRMVKLRERAEKLPNNMVKKSLWELWDGR